jgi:putative ABC transport system permease protein
VAGTVFSSIFTIFGIFSILAGVLLIFLIFVMLAAERRSELGMARAIGVHRRHIVQSFVTEGMLYDVVAAALGLALGLLVSFGMIGFIGGLFNTASGTVTGRASNIFEFRFNVATTSIVIGYCLGVLFTFLVVLISSWRVSRLNIVTAIRDLPDEAPWDAAGAPGAGRPASFGWRPLSCCISLQAGPTGRSRCFRSRSRWSGCSRCSPAFSNIQRRGRSASPGRVTRCSGWGSS